MMIFNFWLRLLCLGCLCLSFKISEAQANSPVILQVKNKDITVNGKSSRVFEIVQPDGFKGLVGEKGKLFHVILENHLSQPTGVHWHGLLLPNNQDGVPGVTQAAIEPGEKYPYQFLLRQAGTYWMHAHYGLQEQKLLTAPLILYDPQENDKAQNIVMFLSDFSFKEPIEIFKELRGQEGSKKMHMHVGADLNDVKYDAYLANWHTLEDPDVIQVKPEQEVRLRIINGSSSSNFFIDLGVLKGEAIAVDGAPINPLKNSKFELAVAQRMDIKLLMPKEKNAYPIMAQGEGSKLQTGILLANESSIRLQLKEQAQQVAPALSYDQEFQLKTSSPLPKKDINRHLVLNLGGDMHRYIWTLNGKAWPDHTPLMVKQGERVELIFINHTEMSHPMHLHGHVFQVVEINGKAFDGALRDTILVQPKSTIKVIFDADDPGIWPLHCHNLYHQYAGMMTTLNYEGFKAPHFPHEDMKDGLKVESQLH